MCKQWRQDLKSRGFCNKTVQLCSALAGGGDVERLGQNVLRRLDAITDHSERALCLDGGAFLQKCFYNKTVQMCSVLCEVDDTKDLGENAWERLDERRGSDWTMGQSEGALCWEARRFLQKLLGSKGSLLEWLQAASQEPDASFLSRGVASTAQVLGLKLVQWVGKPQGVFPGLYTLAGHSNRFSSTPMMNSFAFSPDGKRIVSGSDDKLVKIWNTETGAEVSIFYRVS